MASSPVPELCFLPAPHRGCMWGGEKGEFRDWTTWPHESGGGGQGDLGLIC